jgi:hypothetical protein
VNICRTHYNAPLVPGGKVQPIWECERPQGHAGEHASPSHSVSLTEASRVTTALRSFRVAALICDDCHRTDGSHNLDVEH